MADKTELLHAFRKLYRSGLRAVQYSKPARFIVRDQLRAAFRGKPTLLSGPLVHGKGGPKAFDPLAIRNTVYFLNAAAQYTGLEHKIVRNLVLTAYWRQRGAQNRMFPWSQVVAMKSPKPLSKMDATALDHYDRTIRHLNETMHMCLR